MFLNTVHLFIGYSSDPRLSYAISDFFPVDHHFASISVHRYFVWLQIGTLVDQTPRLFTPMFSLGWCFQIFLGSSLCNQEPLQTLPDSFQDLKPHGSGALGLHLPGKINNHCHLNGKALSKCLHLPGFMERI